MKKLLSVILAGALALTAVSPVMASTDSYASSGILYDEVDFTQFDASTGATIDSLLDGVDFAWNGATGATIEAVEDPVKGTVAKITGAAAGYAPIHFVKGFDQYDIQAHVDAGTLSSDYGSFVYEFDFLDEGTGKWGFYAQEWMSGNYGLYFQNGASVGRGGIKDDPYTLGVWHHVVINVKLGTNSCYFFLDGAAYGDNWHSANYATSDDASWNANTGLRFEAGANVKISNLKKYQLPNNTVYVPADAGDTVEAITSTSEDVTVDATLNAINYKEAVTVPSELMAALTCTNSIAIVAAGEYQDDPDLFDDYAITDVTNVIAVSASGDVLKTYTVAPYEKITISADSKLTVDTDARTIKGNVTDFATVADLRAAITVTEGQTDFVIYAGDAVAEDTADATTITSIVFESETGAVTKTYTVSIRTAEKVFWDLDMRNYADETIANNTYMGNVWIRNPSSGTYSVVEDAELGHEVILAQHSGSNWMGVEEYNSIDALDVASGDYLILEMLVKVPEASAAGPKLSNSWALTSFDSSGTMSTMNGNGFAWEKDKWYHVVMQFSPTDTGCSPIYTWVNGEQAGSTYWPRSDANHKISFWKGVPSSTNFSIRTQNVGDSFYLSKYKLMRSNVPYDAAANGDLATLTDSSDGALTVNETLKTVMYADDEMTVETFKDTIGAPTGATLIVYSDDTALTDEDILADATSVLVRSASASRVETYSLVSKSAATPEVTWDSALTVDEVNRTVTFKETAIKTLADLKAKVTAGNGTTVTYKDSTGAAITDDTASTTTVATITAAKGGVSYDYTVTVTAATKTYVNLDYYTSDSNLTTGTTPLKIVHGYQMAQVMDADMGYSVGEIQWKNTLWGGIMQNGTSVPGELVAGDKLVIETTIKPHAKGVANNPVFAWNGGSSSYTASVYAFDFGYHSASDVIKLHGAAEVPYEANKWYHIVAEYTVGESASTVNMWVNGTQYVTNHTNSTLKLEYVNARLNKSEGIRIMQQGSASADAYVTPWSIAQYSWYRTDFGYDADAQAKDAAALTEASDSITLDAALGTIALNATGLKVSDLKAALTAPAGATVRYLDANGAEVADTAAASTVKKVVSVSSQKTQAISYAVAVTDTASDAYTVNYANMTIEGVWNQTTEEIFKSNITVDGTYTVNVAGKYLADGDTVVTANNTFTVKLEALAHHTGTATSGSGTNYANEDGIHIALKPGTIESVTTDAMQGANDAVLKLTHNGANDFRWVLEEYDNSNGGTTTGATYTQAMAEGEVRNIEFAFMAPTDTHEIRVQMDQNTAIVIKNGQFYYNPDASLELPYTYTAGEWMHIGVSGTRKDAGTAASQTLFKLYINGEYACQMTSTTAHAGTAGGSTGVKVAGGADVVTYMDDIKYYRSATWGIDYDYYYGTIAESASENVVLANGDAWLSNGATVADGFGSTALYAADGSTVAAADLTVGDSFFVKEATNCIFRKYTVKEGSLGATVAADGTLTATVGMVADEKTPAIFVAGVHDDGKFSNIYKVSKANAAADTITYDLNNIGASNAKVYIWDSSLSVLADVAEFVMDADGVWSAK